MYRSFIKHFELYFIMLLFTMFTPGYSTGPLSPAHFIRVVLFIHILHSHLTLAILHAKRIFYCYKEY